MDKTTEDKLCEIDMWVALGEFLRRGNAAAGTNPISPATEIIAGKVSLLYADILANLGNVAEFAFQVRDMVRDNTRMGQDVAAAARDGSIPLDKAIAILNVLIADSEKKASDLEATYG